MGKRKIDPNLKASDEVEKSMKGFLPRFGNVADIDIVNQYSGIKNVLQIMKDDEERRFEMKKIVKNNNARLAQIKKMEDALLWMLKNRV